MTAIRILSATLISIACCTAHAQIGPDFGSGTLIMSLSDIMATPFTLNPAGGTATYSPSFGTTVLEAAFHDGDNVQRFHAYGDKGGASLGAAWPTEQRPNGSVSLAGNFTPNRDFRAATTIEVPDPGVDLVVAAFLSPMTLHLSANSGLTIVGHLTGIQSTFPSTLEYKSFAHFQAMLTDALGNSTSYMRDFGNQTSTGSIDEWFSLTVYNRSNEASDFDWNIQGKQWVSLGAVPEASGIAMMLAGLGVLGLIARKRYLPVPLA